MRTPLAVLATLSLAACSQPVPPMPGPRPEATPVSATFGATWDAVIDHLSASNTPIATIDRSSGIVASTRLSVARSDALDYADCGSSRPDPTPSRMYTYAATSVSYNVLVRGDEQSSSVRVTATWDTDVLGAPFVCETTGRWEAEVEAAVKQSAER